MEAPTDIVLAFHKVVVPAAARPSTQPQMPDHRLEMAVVFTSGPATMEALRRASAMASSLNARITLVHPQTVPYPLPLESPPVLLEFSEQGLQQIALECSVETTVRIYLCRDPLQTLKSVLAPRSLLIVGGQKRWWLTREKMWARQLRRAGHEVIFTESGRPNA